MKQGVLILLLLFTAGLSKAQVYVYAEGGYGTYWMKDMKDFQHDIIIETQLALKKVSTFPGYYNYGGGLGYRINPLTVVGLTLRYMSTGARADYSDYSGSARVDHLLSCYSVGPFINRTINKSKVWPVILFFNLTRVLTKVDVQSSINLIGVGSNSDSFSMTGNSLGGMGSVMVQRNFPHHIFLFGRIGYEAFVNSKLKAPGGTTALVAQWGGARIGLGVGLSFSDNDNTEN